MTLNLDTRLPIRTRAQKQALVRAIRDADASEQETDWLEWKSTADLGDRKWQAEAGRQVLGMANRDPDVASTWVDGCGFFVVGVSPGQIAGTRVYDNGQIDDWITRYVGPSGDGPDWSSEYVEVDGKSVLVVTIEAPRWGQPAWPCRKSHPEPDGDPKNAMADGDIYVRHQAKTERANSADIQMLSRRAARSRKLEQLALAPATGKAVALDHSEEAIQAWAERERKALEPPRPAPTAAWDRSDPTGATQLVARQFAQMQAAIQSMGLGMVDERTEEQYRQEVENYLAEGTRTLPGFLLASAYASKLGRIRLDLRNLGEEPIHKLQVEVWLPDAGVVVATRADDLPEEKMPKRPIMLGRRTTGGSFGLVDLVPSLHPMMPYIPSLDPPKVWVKNEAGAHVTFQALDLLYARDAARLPTISVFVGPGLAGKTVTGRWEARASDRSSVAQGELVLEVEAEARTIEELLAEQAMHKGGKRSGI